MKFLFPILEPISLSHTQKVSVPENGTKTVCVQKYTISVELRSWYQAMISRQEPVFVRELAVPIGVVLIYGHFLHLSLPDKKYQHMNGTE